MSYTGIQTTLLVHAARYHSLGYKVGFSLGKSLVGQYRRPETTMTIFGPIQTNQKVETPEKWDGISLIMDEIVCVDFDQGFVDLGWGRPLPPTLKEKSPRGYHLFYRLQSVIAPMHPKIKFQPGVDLLCKDAGEPQKKAKYGKKPDGGLWGGHVLCSPTPGYKRIYPDELPPANQIAIAPDWLVRELEKSP